MPIGKPRWAMVSGDFQPQVWRSITGSPALIDDLPKVVDAILGEEDDSFA